MSYIVLFALFACLLQNVYSQVLGSGLGMSPLANPAALAGPGALAGPAFGPGFGPGSYNPGPGAYNPGPYGYGGSSPANSPPYGGAGVGDVAVAGEMPVTGTTLVSGHVPILGAVQFSGTLPAGGVVSISGNCGCGNPSYGY